MMPTAADSPERAANKFKLIKQQILEKQRGSIAGAGAAGYDTSGFAPVPETATAPDFSKQPAGEALAGAGKKTVTKKLYSPSRDQTKIIYSDGTEEVVSGKR
jgi:hypothetical protein